MTASLPPEGGPLDHLRTEGFRGRGENSAMHTGREGRWVRLGVWYVFGIKLGTCKSH